MNNGSMTPTRPSMAALFARMAEWGRRDADSLTRVRHLKGELAGGLNGGFLLDGASVAGDGVRDTLVGSARPDPDWFFASDHGRDVMRGFRRGEVVTAI